MHALLFPEFLSSKKLPNLSGNTVNNGVGREGAINKNGMVVEPKITFN